MASLSTQEERRAWLNDPHRVQARQSPVRRRISAERIAAALLTPLCALTTQELADKLGVSHRSIQTWKGKTEADGVQRNMERLADLGVVIDRDVDARNNLWFHKSFIENRAGPAPASDPVVEQAHEEDQWYVGDMEDDQHIPQFKGPFANTPDDNPAEARQADGVAVHVDKEGNRHTAVQSPFDLARRG